MPATSGFVHTTRFNSTPYQRMFTERYTMTPEGIQIDVSVKCDLGSMKLTPEQLKAFFEGVAAVLNAKTHVPVGVSISPVSTPRE
mgnify:CR=1 FL=1